MTGSCPPQAGDSVTDAAQTEPNLKATSRSSGTIRAVATTQDDEPTAWSLAETRRAWRRSGLWATAVLVAGLAMLAGGLTYVVVVTDNSDALMAGGARVMGTVVEDQPPRLRCGQVKVPMQFELEGVEHTENLAVDSCYSNLTQGEQITLYVDPANPSNLVSDDSYNENGLALLAAVVALILGVALPACALFRGGRLIRARHTLRGGPWTERTVRRLNIPSGARGLGHAVLVLTDVHPPELLELRWPATVDPSDTSPSMVVRSAARWAVVAHDPGSHVVAARVPRERVARKVMALIVTQEDSQTPP